MNQQINLYQIEYRPQTRIFSPSIMLQSVGITVLVMMLIYGFASQRVAGIERELEFVSRQESAATERLQNLRPLITAAAGEQSWAERLDEAVQTLQERQAVLSLVQGSALGETNGFSRHMRALARQDINGIWLTHIVLSALGDKTRLEGRAIRADLVPLYVQDLTAEAPFAEQRFHRFQIDGPPDDAEVALHFSMDSQVLLARDTGNDR